MASNRSIIFNADDFGFDKDTFQKTKELLDGAHIKSATILVGFPETAAAIEYAKAHQNQMSFGLHFNIAEGRPFSKQRVDSLVDASGSFSGPFKQRIRALLGQLSPAHISAELESQLAYLRDHGLEVSHLDSHGHLHKFPRVMEAISPVLVRFGISRVRIPQTHYDKPRFYNQFLDRYCMKSFQKAEHRTASFFNTRSHTEDWLTQFLNRLPEGLTEIGIHPGTVEAWRRIEFAALAHDSVKPFLVANNISNISYKDI